MKGIDKFSIIRVPLSAQGAELLTKSLPRSIESGYGFLEVRVCGQMEGIFTGDP